MGGKSNCIRLNIIIGFLGIVAAIGTFFGGRQFEKSKIPKAECNIEILSDSRQINSRYETQALFEIRNLGLLKDASFYFEIELDESYEIIEVKRKNGTFSELEDKRGANFRAFTAPFWGKRSIEGTIVFRSFIPFTKGEVAHPIHIRW